MGYLDGNKKYNYTAKFILVSVKITCTTHTKQRGGRGQSF